MNNRHNNNSGGASCGGPHSMTPQQLAAGRQHMVEAFLRVMSCGDTDSLYWLGTQTDLIEIVYLIFTLRIMHHADGRPCSFGYLTRRACAVLHTPAPANPSMVAQKALSRKGVRQSTMAERYAWKKCVMGIEEPLAEEIRNYEG